MFSLDDAKRSPSIQNTKLPVTWLLKNTKEQTTLAEVSLAWGFQHDHHPTRCTCACLQAFLNCSAVNITDRPFKLGAFSRTQRKGKRTSPCSLTTQKKPQRQSMPDTHVQQYYSSCLGTNASSLPSEGCPHSK